MAAFHKHYESFVKDFDQYNSFLKYTIDKLIVGVRLN